MNLPPFSHGQKPENRSHVTNLKQFASQKGRRRRDSYHPSIEALLNLNQLKPLTDFLPPAIDTPRTDSEGSSGSNTPVNQPLIQREELDTIVFDQCFTKSINSDILELLSSNVDGFNQVEFKNHYRYRFNQFLVENKDTLFKIASEAGILDPLELSAFILVMLVKADNQALEELPKVLYEDDLQKFKRYVSFEREIVLKGYAAISIVPLQDSPGPIARSDFSDRLPPI